MDGRSYATPLQSAMGKLTWHEQVDKNHTAPVKRRFLAGGPFWTNESVTSCWFNLPVVELQYNYGAVHLVTATFVQKKLMSQKIVNFLFLL